MITVLLLVIVFNAGVVVGMIAYALRQRAYLQRRLMNELHWEDWRAYLFLEGILAKDETSLKYWKSCQIADGLTLFNVDKGGNDESL